MKIRLYYLIACLCYISFSYAQQKGIKVEYVNFTDTLLPEDKKYVNTVIISGGKSVSYKIPYESKKPGVYLVSQKDGISRYEYYFDTDTMKLYVFKDLDEGFSHFQSEINFVNKKSRTYSDSLHPFKWQIVQEQKYVVGRLCRKATMDFRGRSYIAWFDETIPFNNGPWKFGGLPGLILEIHDSTYTVFWRIHKLAEQLLQLPQFPQNITETYYDFKKGYKEKFERIKKILESTDQTTDPSCESCVGNKKTISNNTVEDLIN